MTHFNSKAKEACQLYAWLLYDLLMGEDKKTAYSKIFLGHPYYSQYDDLSLLKKIDKPSYVAESLLAAIIIFYNTNSYEEGYELLKKTKGSYEFAGIAGGILGLYYGHSNIPKKLLSKINIGDTIKIYQLSNKLLKVRRSGK